MKYESLIEILSGMLLWRIMLRTVPAGLSGSINILYTPCLSLDIVSGVISEVKIRSSLGSIRWLSPLHKIILSGIIVIIHHTGLVTTLKTVI